MWFVLAAAMVAFVAGDDPQNSSIPPITVDSTIFNPTTRRTTFNVSKAHELKAISTITNTMQHWESTSHNTQSGTKQPRNPQNSSFLLSNTNHSQSFLHSQSASPRQTPKNLNTSIETNYTSQNSTIKSQNLNYSTAHSQKPQSSMIHSQKIHNSSLPHSNTAQQSRIQHTSSQSHARVNHQITTNQTKPTSSQLGPGAPGKPGHSHTSLNNTKPQKTAKISGGKPPHAVRTSKPRNSSNVTLTSTAPISTTSLLPKTHRLTKKSHTIPVVTSPPLLSSSSAGQVNTSALLGMGVYYGQYDLPTITIEEDELVVIGDNVSAIKQLWLHPSPVCGSSNDSRSLKLSTGSKSNTFISARVATIQVFRPEWIYPVFVCTRPQTKMSDFQTVIIEDSRDPLLFILIFIYFFFLMLSALFTGLNLSLMSLDVDDLRRIREYDENPKTRRYAANILPIRENGNYMLCTILLGNTICNAICVLTFDRMTGGLVMSITTRLIFINVVPTMFIIIFSEIFPQVLCTKYALPIGSRCRHLMVFFMVLTFPVSYPLSMILDFVVGKEMRATMDRRMLGELMRQQNTDTTNMAEVVENAMNLQVRRVRDVMTPLDKVFMLSELTEVNSKLKRQLSENRHTRIPVYKADDKNCIIGVLNVKDLLLIDDSLDLQVNVIMQLWYRTKMFRYVSAETPVVQLMPELKRGFPLAIVIDYMSDLKCYHVIGIVTLEDNIEEVIGEIYDEKDVKRALEADMIATTPADQSLKKVELHVTPVLQAKKVKKAKLAAVKKVAAEKKPLAESAPLLPPVTPSVKKKASSSIPSSKSLGAPDEKVTNA